MRDTFNYDIFISHSAKDKSAAKKLAKQLKHDGLKVTTKEKDLHESRTLVLLLSEATFTWEWVTLEQHTLMFRDPTNTKRRFIPLLIQTCTIPDVIAQFDVIDWRVRSDASYAKLFSACRPKETPVIEPTAAKERVIKALMVLEGHKGSVHGVAFTLDGKRLVSSSRDRTLKLWDLESGQCIATFVGHTSTIYGLDISLDGKRMVSASVDGTIRVWELPEPDVRVEPFLSTRYTNAKVVLVGESGVGKTGLAIRLAEDRWQVTDSTHGMNVWPLPLPGVKNANMEREVWLWDFAGQPDYRLIHQLYMDETALALMVIDPQQDNPFENLGHWEKALAAAVIHNPAKLLVAGRCDRGGITVSTGKLGQYCQTKNYSTFINTAAKNGDGCEELKKMISSFIPWDRLPWTATTILFKTLKDAVIRIKDQGFVLTRISELRQRLQLELKETIEEKDLRAVVGLLAGQGIVQQLDFGDFVLLQPEQINNYASAVIRCVRENIDEIGCIREQDVLEANIDFKDMPRLSETDEKILVRAMVQTFLDRSLCLREETALGTQLK